MPKRELSKEEPKKIDDWDFLTKYQMLSPELKLLHQIVLLRSDTDTIIYILLSFIPLILALKYNLAIAFFSVTILRPKTPVRTRKHVWREIKSFIKDSFLNPLWQKR